MKLIRDLGNLADQRGSVATIGGFDGVHLGHQALLRTVRAKADELRLPMTVVSFEPSPREFFLGKDAPARLQRFREKFYSLRAMGVDQFVCLHFNEQFASISASEWVSKLWHERLAVRWLIVGDDFRFGKGREGSVATLRELTQRYGIGLTVFDPYEISGDRVSSTLIRDALAQGDMTYAAQLLGRRYTMTSRVIHGEKLGRTLGFPTANLRLHRRVIPLKGVFAVRVTGAGLQDADAVASLGTRPVVNGVEPLLEVHVFDFNGDLYGQQLQVEFIERLRDEVWFPDLDALAQQMHQDVAQARMILSTQVLSTPSLSTLK